MVLVLLKSREYSVVNLHFSVFMFAAKQYRKIEGLLPNPSPTNNIPLIE